MGLSMVIWLVVWNMFVHSVGNVIIPTDELLFFRGVGIPPTDAMMGINSWKWDWHEAIFEQDDGNRNGIEVPFLCVGLSTPSN